MLRTVLLLDGSDAMNSSADYLPNYLLAMRPPLLRLVEHYLDSTPLASMGVVVMRDGISHRLLPCTTNRNDVIDVLERDVFLHGGSGSTSVENGLRMAMSELVDMRKVAALAAAAAASAAAKTTTAAKEVSAAAIDPHTVWKGSATQLTVILVSASVTLIDPTDVFAVVHTMAAVGIRIHVVSLVGAVHVFDVCAVETGGSLHCPLSYDHLLRIVEELATSHRTHAALARRRKRQRESRQRRVTRSRADCVDGVADSGADAPRLLPFGCPMYLEAPVSDSAAALPPSDGAVAGGARARSLYIACPQCHLIQLTVPTTCPMCRLLLCSAPMLYSTYVSLNTLTPPAAPLRVVRDTSSSTAAAAVARGANVVRATLQQPVRCCLCSCVIPASVAAAPARTSACSNAVADSAQAWQCSACASYRCNACHDTVLHTLGLCPQCVALQ
ncbi:Ssl1-like [Novymonas esmeraldas]|uniref:Ssl1-like n=1 Tax=Novymonas esmeraldas TaxID=1808958 RepID=A0AAW0EYP9_9TRYP